MTLEYWKLVAGLVKMALWPAAVIFLAHYFKNEIRALVPRLRKAGLAGVEFGDTGHKQADPSAKNLSNVEELGQLEKPDSKPPKSADIHARPSTQTIKMIENSIQDQLKLFEAKHRIPLLVRELAQTRLGAAFERVYFTIYGSQILGLRLLEKEGGKVSLVTAQGLFKNLKTQFPEFYEKGTFEQWFSFISGNGLSDVKGDFVEITPVGRDFLLYLSARGLPENKPW